MKIIKVLTVIVFLISCATYVQSQDKPTPEPPKTITVGDLQKRLTELETGLDQAKANMHAYEGAIADCKYWMEQLNKPAPPEVKSAIPVPNK